MASVTKICATTISVMKLFDEGKLKLDAKLGDYLPEVKNTDKQNLTIRNILLHQAGLVAYIPFYKKIQDSTTGALSSIWYSKEQNENYNIKVAENIFLRKDYLDSIAKQIALSKLVQPIKYIYSDNDFIYLGKIVEKLSGKTLDKYVDDNFYKPLGLYNTGFNPLKNISYHNIAPTEREKGFRNQLLHGYVHDPGAALMGGVAGHAGLFSDAYGIASIMQLLLDGGYFNGIQFIRKSTIKLFTQYTSSISRRALGFDKPEKDNASSKSPYPCLSIPLSGFGHTGFTGTCAWADPNNDIVFVFLSNRVHPDGGDNKKLLNMNIRGRIHEKIYEALR